ncbi:Peroxisome biosynthesis protein pex1 [Coemansia spiralis]|uniref:Peroxisomal ATPase PEX1 n=1 Tax=Coemansia spiralis TaxID=417178 RepID=A0A9W8GB09_9FUNG|nr:Peroxisome biosynthesis protein pex1 [Coemansia spiralis]
MSQNLVVAFRPLRSCQVNLPARWVSALSAQSASKGYMVFKLLWQSKSDSDASAYVTWSGGVSRLGEQRDNTGALSQDNGVLEIDGSFASRLEITEGTHVALEYISNVPICTAAEVVPVHYDDWEILELNAGAVESRLLQQVRVVAVDQPIVFWLNQSTSVCLMTTNITPKAQSCCLLDNDTEVIVAPKVRSQKKILGDGGAVLTSNGLDQQMQSKKSRICCLRLAAAATADTDVKFGVVYANSQSAIVKECDRITSASANKGLEAWGGSQSANIGDIIRIGHTTQDNISLNQNNDDSASGGASLSPWVSQLVVSDNIQPGVLLGSLATFKAAGYKVGELIRAQVLDKSAVATPIILTIVSEQPTVNGKIIKESLAGLLEMQSQIIVNVGMSVMSKLEPSLSDVNSLGKIVSFLGLDAAEESESPETPLCITKPVLEELEIELRIESRGLDSSTKLDIVNSGYAKGVGSQLAGVDAFLEEAWACVESALLSRGEGSGILLCGRRGSGKSSIAKYLSKKASLEQQNRLIYCRHIDCTALALDPRTGTVKDMLQAIAKEVLMHQPSLLVLDDLDALVPAENEQTDSRKVRQLVDTLVAHLIAQDGRRTTVLATATGRTQLHTRLFSAGLFQDVLEIPAPGKAERELILAAIAQSNVTKADTTEVNFSALSYLTEGYMPADLHGLYERAVHEATMRVLESLDADNNDADSAVVVQHDDLVRAHAGFKPLSMRGVQLQKSQTRWSDIGGLEDTRRQLRETLELPTKYAAIFATSPLRLRSGVMLYGYPGCGKTLLASAVARECGLNFIATKGPELLSKYIGSSEQAVRDLFRRAVAAAPCVLFFDEFDSIAPRRGHDNTGVTDRVVNQFLTEMDGAEGLKGVYVLAATSRPDLIDPALLRPGRLDKAFLCGMPNHSDRKDILTRQATKVRIDEDVDWDAVAKRTESFTGADLQALVYNAFLEAVHELTDKRKAEDGSDANNRDEHKQAVFEDISSYGSSAKTATKPLSAVEHTQLAERLFRLLQKDNASGISDSTDTPANKGSSDGLANTPLVRMKHFESAFAVTQSSLGDQDRQRFETIYRDFVDDKKRSSDRPHKPIEQKATLA